ncbi:MAG: multi-sensor hybrid histidine kinase [bacterium]|nr:MAG: multi-sensor hybrid histidine kinase [bacterium]
MSNLKRDEYTKDFNQQHISVLKNKLAKKVVEVDKVSLRLATIVELGLTLITEENQSKLFEQFCSSAQSLIGAQYAIIAIVEANNTKNFQHFSIVGLDEKSASLVSKALPYEKVFSRLLLQGSHPFALNNVLEHIDLPNGYPETSSLVVVPLISRRKNYGWMCLGNKLEEKEFSLEDKFLLLSIATQVLVAYENAQLYTSAQKEIAQRKKIEIALQEERVSLAKRVEERTLDLSITNAELMRLARLKDEFLAGMSHELRTPLNAILGMTEALEEEVYGQVNEKQQKALKTIEESGVHLLSLINDILDISKLEAGKVQLEIDNIGVKTICESSIRLIKETAYKKNLKVNFSMNPTSMTLKADPRRLKQILVNLLSNAVKFTPSNGEIGLEVIGDLSNETIHFAVWDTGIGISQENASRLFKPFVQLDSSLSREYAGTGLGLSLVSRLVELHGGSVLLESEIEKGSRFVVSIPWQEQIETGVINQNSSQCLVKSIQRALIVEDSPHAVAQTARYLKEHNISVFVHNWGTNVIESLIKTQADLLILDIILPDESGWSVLKHVKKDPRTQQIPVLVVSVLDEKPKAIALGASGYLIKPFSRQQFLVALNNITSINTQVTEKATQEQLSPLILIAEDNEASINILYDFLLSKYYRVSIARNGQEAIDLTLENKPDIILMDIQMPKVTGLEAITRIRANPSLANTPIIALTALAMPGDRERCLKIGANEYMTKPVSLNKLTITIEELLSKAKEN